MQVYPNYFIIWYIQNLGFAVIQAVCGLGIGILLLLRKPVGLKIVKVALLILITLVVLGFFSDIFIKKVISLGSIFQIFGYVLIYYYLAKNVAVDEAFNGKAISLATPARTNA